MSKQNKSIACALREQAYIWLGVTNKENTYALIFKSGKNTNFCRIENTEDHIILYASKETKLLSTDIFTVLYEIFPDWRKKDTGEVEESKLPAKLSIVSDCNELLFSQGIKFLKESTVRPFLDNLGINISLYEYTKIKIDNSHKLVASSVLVGYDKYPKECLLHAKDVSKYKNYTIEHTEVFTMLNQGCYKGIIATGAAGVGKTTEFFADSAKSEIPVIDFQCVHNTQFDDLIGKWIPKADGGFEFLYGPLALAIKYDCRFSCQEWNYAPTEVQSLVNSIMDDNGTITLPNGEVLTVGSNFRMFLTVNPGYRGTNMFNQATLNRFVVVHYPALSKDTLIERLMFETGYKNMKVLDAIGNAYEKLRGIFQTRNMETEITYRNALRFLKMILLNPNSNISEDFNMAFINNAIFEMSDIETELVDLKEVCKEYVKDIQEALLDGSEEVKEGSFDWTPRIDLDGIVDLNNDANAGIMDVEEDA